MKKKFIFKKEPLFEDGTLYVTINGNTFVIYPSKDKWFAIMPDGIEYECDNKGIAIKACKEYKK
jgi:hypothetical protein